MIETILMCFFGALIMGTILCALLAFFGSIYLLADAFFVDMRSFKKVRKANEELRQAMINAKNSIHAVENRILEESNKD